MAENITLNDEDKQSLEVMIANAVQTALKENPNNKDDEEEDTQEESEQLQTQATQQRQLTPMEQMIAPYLQQSQLQAAAVNDKADFYTEHTIVKDGNEDEEEGTVSRSMRKDIEKMFNDRMKQGRPETREAIYHYLLGKNITKIKQRSSEKSNKRKAQEMQNAQAGFDIGSGNASQSLSVDQMWNAPLEKLQGAIVDVTF